ncbi:MAG: glycosyltransferase family 4 protein [Phycisphaerales bacterium]
MIHYMTSEGLGSPWVGNELRIVTQAGVPVRLHCMRAPTRIHFDSDWAKRMQADATALYPVPPPEVFAATLAAPFRFGARFFAALANAVGGERENIRARMAALAHFFVACMWAGRLKRSGEQVSHIHAQWAFSSASIAMYGAWLLGVPFSFTGHAVDLTRQRVALRDKIRRAAFIIAISEWHKQFYIDEDKGRTPGLASKIHVAYCGIYTDEMVPPGPATTAARAGQPFTILSAGRLIEKKGFPHLVRACRVLKDRGRHFRCTIAGSGPDEAGLRALIGELGVGDVVSMTGAALQQEKIPAFMHQGDCFVLACVWAADGDVDGLPQLTMEAMGCGLPAVTTALVGNPDLVIHERTGLLVDVNGGHPDAAFPARLADAIQRLMDDPTLRAQLARDGRTRIFDVFDITRSLNVLIGLYRRALGAPHGGTA